MKDGKYASAIVGCGVIGPWHATASENIEESYLAAVCDVVEEKAKSLAEERGVPDSKVYTDYAEMLKDDEVDIVHICTPSGMHSDMAVAAAQAGKHVLCEKPMDITLEKADAMIGAADQAGIKMGVIFQRRTYKSTQIAREAVQSGKLGKMVLGDCYQKYYRSPEYYLSGEWRGTWELDGGGALMNQGVHGIDAIRYIMGKPKSIYAKADHLVRDIEVEDTACAVIEWECGAFGVIQGTTSVTPGQSCRLALHGDKGTIELADKNIVTWKIEGEEEELPSTDDEPTEGTASDPKALSASGHIAQLEDLIQAIKEDGRPMCDGREGRGALEIILAIYESARTGEVVHF